MATPGVISDHHGEHRAAAFTVNAIPAVAGVAFSLLVGAVRRHLVASRTASPALRRFFVVAATCTHPRAPPARSPRHFATTVKVQFAFMINATLAEFTVGIWGVGYLRGGGASTGWRRCSPRPSVCRCSGRINLPFILRHLGRGAVSAVSCWPVSAQ
jgi:hypothetical protein